MPQAPLVLELKNDKESIRSGLAKAFQDLSHKYTKWELISMTTHHPPRRLSPDPNYWVVIYTICYRVR